ncbi:MAG: Smr/MutS family protein [Zymomonas mobilis subsp. pomaceae]|uniref:Smr protein/MutS2 n=1 Tax=Zymomonas mobilis subsp. pomaceae (strain ATCC 29192 / DSM 22645 / JCM 10191 / CCUG 17912 / NBRC 13757 / NCIMB 11200 / NRRL B-4491 / Barker I) TaxID=579138 RepID=F8EVM7_ZYMMT|nr:Smr/MutS family protein [Zymomonas mobilis]AEI38364.1 Smr protein/MutS2 [Zymomonas mobilis subsp. pomaceae ATCC 29192]MDX5948053.1 Smr/MutS family protein [Zymomonas mobilis subsp. pomaceae]GEB89383.1 smr protein/Muts2-like [Zymomonas mobilis subsp. pomaceae]
MTKRKRGLKYPVAPDQIKNKRGDFQDSPSSLATLKFNRDRLSSEDLILWRKVASTVKPLDLDRYQSFEDLLVEDIRLPQKIPSIAAVTKRMRERQKMLSPPPTPLASSKNNPDTLDGSWDRRLSKGSVEPERSIDLHGYTMTSAHRVLEMALSKAIMQGIRVLLIITGRPPRRNDQGIITRGLIRGAIGDWLSFSPYASHIAAVRNAHPKHGGAGALYVILRRKREK